MYNVRPMVDLVLNHVAIDSDLVGNKQTKFHFERTVGSETITESVTIDTTRWFKRHLETGNLVIHGRDAHYKKQDKTTAWDDVAQFNYDNPKIRKEIIDFYFKPLIKALICDMGFSGFRLDAPGMIPPQVFEELVPYMDELCQKEHGVPALNIAETVGDYWHNHVKVGKTGDYGPGFADYAYDSTFYAATDSFGFHGNNKGQLFDQDDGWPAQVREKTDAFLRGGRITFYDHRIHEDITEIVPGGTRGVGSITSSLGSHDEERYTETLINNGITEPSDIVRSLKRKFAIGAFFSSAGYYLHRGDEYGVLSRSGVFTASPDDLKNRVEGVDLSGFIKDINATLARLPDPAEKAIGWAQVVELPDEPELLAVITHHGPGHDGRRDLIIVNLSESPKEINCVTVREFMEANGRNKREHEASVPEAIHLISGATPSVELIGLASDKGVELYDTPKFSSYHRDVKSTFVNRYYSRKVFNLVSQDMRRMM